MRCCPKNAVNQIKYIKLHSTISIPFFRISFAIPLYFHHKFLVHEFNFNNCSRSHGKVNKMIKIYYKIWTWFSEVKNNRMRMQIENWNYYSSHEYHINSHTKYSFIFLLLDRILFETNYTFLSFLHSKKKTLLFAWHVIKICAW